MGVQIKGGSENCSENWQSLEILDVFYTLIVKLVFSKTQTIFRKLEYPFLLKVLRLKTQHFHTKLLCQKPILRQIECGVQNSPITKNEVYYFIF